MKKFSISFVLGLAALMLISPQHVSASTEVEEVSVTTEVQLDEIGQYNETPVYTDEGEYMGKIVVEAEPTLPKIGRGLIHSETANNRNYNVHFIGVTANVGFGITVNNKNITKAFDAWANGLIWNVSTSKLTRNNKEAKLPGTASFGVKGFGANTTFRLRAVISGSQLQTHLDVP